MPGGGRRDASLLVDIWRQKLCTIEDHLLRSGTWISRVGRPADPGPAVVHVMSVDALFGIAGRMGESANLNGGEP
jgi:hypothetical protein